MPIKKQTISPTEADFEGNLQAALLCAFPWIPAGQIVHQTKFSFTFGHATVVVDGKAKERVEGRSDILLSWKDKNLAILELKRPGTVLTSDDEKQGLSYARILVPSAPLVVVSNGKDIRLLETHTGLPWITKPGSEAEFERLIQSSATAAESDIRDAVGVLMGTNRGVWSEAVRLGTEQALSDLSGKIDEILQPFVSDFLVPRDTTKKVFELLIAGKRVVVVDGPPLIGKSNVLRELAYRCEEAGWPALFVDGMVSSSIFESIAETFARSLGWPIQAKDSQIWMERISKSIGTPLVLIVDGLDYSREEILKELQKLASGAFGEGLRIVFSSVDSITERLIRSTNGRQNSYIGRIASRISVGPYCDQEFLLLQEMLRSNGFELMPGSALSDELRIPWVLRSLVAQTGKWGDPVEEDICFALPPLVTIDLIDHARKLFSKDKTLCWRFYQVGRALIEDTKDRTRPVGIQLLSVETFRVLRTTLHKYLERADIEALELHGYLKASEDASSHASYIIRTPEILAGEIAGILAEELLNFMHDPVQAAKWLVDQVSFLPLGDVIGAQAILDACIKNQFLPLELILALLNVPATQTAIQPGTRLAFIAPNGDPVEVLVTDKEVWHEANILDLGGWLILSHIAGKGIEVSCLEGSQYRVDLQLLIKIGSSPTLIRRVTPMDRTRGIYTYQIPGHGEVVRPSEGIVEPIVYAMYRRLIFEGATAERWLYPALDKGPLALIARFEIALKEVARATDSELAAWAITTLREILNPARDRRLRGTDNT